MSVVRILNVSIPEPKSHFLAPYRFEVTFECLSPLQDDLEFKIVYVGSAENTALDQELDSLLVGPVPVGVNRFEFVAEAPKVEKIPKEDLVGVAVVLLTCSYKDKEFERIGYYVDNAYADEELQQNPPDVPQLDKVSRSILADKPRVTRFPINWDDPHRADAPPAQGADGSDAEMDAEAADDDGDDEEDEEEDEDEEDEDDGGEVDLAMTEEQDEAELASDYEEPDDDEKMAADAKHSAPVHMDAAMDVAMDVE
ncbi:Histone chaperone asf1 [Coemansia sp. Benny D160-2]|nr:Histone chaperone asf1 [Coemansia sp. Benny D160-2]